MAEKQSGPPVIPLVIGGVMILLGCVVGAVVLYFVVGPGAGTGTRAANRATATVEIVRTVSLPTATFEATEVPTETPVPTETTAPTEESTAGPSATTPPTQAATQAQAQPTAVPRTNTPVPPTAVPASARILNPQFSLEKTTVAVNERIWFNFSVTNADSENKLPFGFLGAAVLDSAGTNVYFQASWTGSDLAGGQTLNWRDGLAIGTAGTYTLALSICYSTVEQCQSGGEWEVLTPAVSVVVQ